MLHTRRYHPDSEAEGGGTKVEPRRRRDDKSPATCGVRYGAMKWLGEFRTPSHFEAKCGAPVVVQTDRGIEIGEQLDLLCRGLSPRIDSKQVKLYTENSGGEFYRFRAGRVLRTASAQDVNEHKRLNEHVRQDLAKCGELAKELNLKMKPVAAEHLLGGERIIFHFRSEGRIDFRELVRQLAQHYQTRIEMRQVGARDEARLIADYEICGRECCCRNFLKKLRPVTMRMAKLQKSTLDPSKVSGRCGRLRCCLRYEHEVYDELLRKLPKLGARVETEFGSATVIDRHILTQLLLVRGDNDQVVAVPLEELGPAKKETPPPAETKSATEPAPAPSKFEPEKAIVKKTDTETSPGEKPERSSRRRRRRRKKTADAAGQQKTETPASPNTSEKPDSKAQTPDQAGEKSDSPKRSSRQRRRRRSRKTEPDQSAAKEKESPDT